MVLIYIKNIDTRHGLQNVITNSTHPAYSHNEIMCSIGEVIGRVISVLQAARSYMFSVQNPGKMFSEHVLGTQAFILRAL